MGGVFRSGVAGCGLLSRSKMEGLRQSPVIVLFLSLLPLLRAPSSGQLTTRGEAPEGGGRVKAEKKGRGWTATYH